MTTSSSRRQSIDRHVSVPLSVALLVKYIYTSVEYIVQYYTIIPLSRFTTRGRRSKCRASASADSTAAGLSVHFLILREDASGSGVLSCVPPSISFEIVVLGRLIKSHSYRYYCCQDRSNRSVHALTIHRTLPISCPSLQSPPRPREMQ